MSGQGGSFANHQPPPPGCTVALRGCEKIASVLWQDFFAGMWNQMGEVVV